MSTVKTQTSRRRFITRHLPGLGGLIMGFGLGYGTPRQALSKPHSVSSVAEQLPEELRRWQSRPRIPIMLAKTDQEIQLLKAIAQASPIKGLYYGEMRHITPLLLFAVGRLPDDPADEWLSYGKTDAFGHPSGPRYLLAWDHHRHAQRTFKADNLSLLIHA
jgi:hypothetical protein